MKWNHKTIFLLCGILSLFLFLFFQSFPTTFHPDISKEFPSRAFTYHASWRLEIAATNTARTLGLGGRDQLPPYQGMLFLFPMPGHYGFWMEGMRFPLDIIFLFRGKVLSIERSLSPTSKAIYYPVGLVDQVLEVNAGEADRISPGDRIWYWRSLGYFF